MFWSPRLLISYRQYIHVIWILLFLQLDIILDQDAFVHFYKGPTEILEPIASHTMFLIDLSRSMAGSKLIMAKESLILLLEDLNEKDYFKIIFFSEKWIRDLPQTFTGWWIMSTILYKRGPDDDNSFLKFTTDFFFKYISRTSFYATF